MVSFTEQAQFYATYHHENITKYLHMIGVPLILLSFMVFFGFVRIVILGVLDVNLSEIATLILLGYYFRLQWRVALIVMPILIFLLWIAEFFSYDGPTSFALWSFFVILFLGCVIQAIGYFIEGKHPAFADNLWIVLIAPLIVAAEVLFTFGFMRKLKEAVHGKEAIAPPTDPM